MEETLARGPRVAARSGIPVLANHQSLSEDWVRRAKMFHQRCFSFKLLLSVFPPHASSLVFDGITAAGASYVRKSHDPWKTSKGEAIGSEQESLEVFTTTNGGDTS